MAQSTVEGTSAPETLLPLVYAIARTVGHTLPRRVEVDDLVHDGVVGLLESIRRFDPARGVDFRTYASYRIRGAIFDGLRARDPLPRGIRRALKNAEKSEEMNGSHGAADPGTPARPLPPVTALVSLEEARSVPRSGGEPEELLLAWEEQHELRRAVAGLSARDRHIIALRFGRGMRLREVAAHYGISITRVAEVQERAMRRLRRALAVPQPGSLSPNGRVRRSRNVPP